MTNGVYDYSKREARLPKPVDATLDQSPIHLDTRIDIYRMQQELRQFEKRAYDLFMQNLVKGTSHLSLGMEAVAAGFAVAMNPDDYTFATYRGHAHTLARGAPMGEVMADAVSGTMERYDLFAGLRSYRIPGTQWVGNQLIALGMLYYKLKDRL